jgi:hypothetical protein
MLNFAIDMLVLRARNFDEAGIGLSTANYFLNKHIVRESNSRLRDAANGKPVALIHYAGCGSRNLQNAPRFADIYLSYLERGCHHIGIDVARCL